MSIPPSTCQTPGRRKQRRARTLGADCPDIANTWIGYVLSTYERAQRWEQPTWERSRLSVPDAHETIPDPYTEPWPPNTCPAWGDTPPRPPGPNSRCKAPWEGALLADMSWNGSREEPWRLHPGTCPEVSWVWHYQGQQMAWARGPQRPTPGDPYTDPGVDCEISHRFTGQYADYKEGYRDALSAVRAEVQACVSPASYGLTFGELFLILAEQCSANEVPDAE